MGSPAADALQQIEIMGDDSLRLPAFGDVFAQLGEQSGDAARLKRAGGRKRVVHFFTGQEAGGGGAHKSELRSVFTQPAAFGKFDENVPGEIHSGPILREGH